jgi:hypothetical protein
VTTPGDNGELLLAAIVEMVPGSAEAGQQYEDAVLSLLGRHGGSLERRVRGMDRATEVHLIRFRSRDGYESFLADPDRLDHRARAGEAAPTARVLEVRETEAT